MKFCILAVGLLCAGILYSFPSKAQENPPKNQQFPEFSRLVSTLNDALSGCVDHALLMTQSGAIVALTNIDTPEKWREQQFRFLTDTVCRKKIRLYQSRSTDKQANRYNQRIGYSVDVQSGEWIERALVRRGLSRVMPQGQIEDGITALLVAESQARGEKAGIWADPDLQIRDAAVPDALIRDSGRYTVIEGTVRAVAQVKNTVYLNFGERWQTDFTIIIDPVLRRAFARDGVDVLRLAGQRVRVRGVVEQQNGPAIILWQKSMLELN